MKKVKAEKKGGQPLKTSAKMKQESGKDQKIEKADDADLPGYPHYRASDDILNRSTRVEAEDLDELSVRAPKAGKDKKQAAGEMKTNSSSEKDPVKIVPGTEADLTKEDLLLLGSSSLSYDLGDDELLKHRSHPVDMAGEDLDIPGAELDDADEEVGEEDEENNNYSIGGDRHEDLEENKS